MNQHPYVNQPKEEPVDPTEALASFIEAMCGADSVTDVFQCSAEWVWRVVGCDRVSLALPSANSDYLEMHALSGRDSDTTASCVPIDATLLGEAYSKGHLVATSDFASDPRSDLQIIYSAGLRSKCCTPMVARGQVIGVLGVARKKEGPFAAEEQRLLKQLAAVIGAQYSLHRRVQDSRAAKQAAATYARGISALNRLQFRLANLTTEEEVHRTATRFVPRLIQSARMSIAVLDPDDPGWLRISALKGANHEVPQGNRFLLQDSYLFEVITKKKTITWEDPAAPDRPIQVKLASMGLRSGVSAPLICGDTVFGTFNIARETVGHLHPSEVLMVNQIARVIASALAGVRAHQALATARETAEAASVAKGTFLANVSHELRTPLNGVIGMSQLLGETALVPDQRELVDTIRCSGQLLLQVIQDVLDVSKIESGEVVLAEERFQLDGLMSGAADLVRSAAIEKGLDLHVWVDPDAPEGAVGDTTRLTQILVNLLSNAIKFTAEGSVTGHLERLGVKGDMDRYRLVIQDTGKGIAADALEDIFVPFKQEDSSITRRFGGTGLGLSICRQLAKLMDGEISVASTLGEGSSFTVELSLRREEKAAEGAVEQARGKSAGRDTPQKPAEPVRVGVLTGNINLQRVATSRLARLGFAPVGISAHARFDAPVATGTDPGIGATTGANTTAADDPSLRAILADLDHPESPTLIPLGLKVIAIAGAGDPLRSTAPEGFHGCLPRTLRLDRVGSALHPGRSKDSTLPMTPGATVDASFDESFAGVHPMEILVVDDNAVNRRVAERFLKKLGYRPRVAASGLEAVAAAAEHAFDLILMDLSMPNMDGYEASVQILGAATDVPPTIFALSADVRESSKERCLAMGMKGIIPKPFDLATLTDALSAA